MPATTLVQLPPTQVTHPWKATLRTTLQVAVAAFPTLLLAVPEVVNILMEEVGAAGFTMPGWAYGTLTAVAAACTVLAAILARLMASARVNELLDKVGLGAGRNHLEVEVEAVEPQRGLDEDMDGEPDIAPEGYVADPKTESGYN